MAVEAQRQVRSPGGSGFEFEPIQQLRAHEYVAELGGLQPSRFIVVGGTACRGFPVRFAFFAGSSCDRNQPREVSLGFRRRPHRHHESPRPVHET